MLARNLTPLPKCKAKKYTRPPLNTIYFPLTSHCLSANPPDYLSLVPLRDREWLGPRFSQQLRISGGYSQRNTFAERAVQAKKTKANAATSPMCADHASPLQIPSRSDTA